MSRVPCRSEEKVIVPVRWGGVQAVRRRKTRSESARLDAG